MKPVLIAADLLFRRQLRFSWHTGPRVEWVDPKRPVVDHKAVVARQRRDELKQILVELAMVLDDMPDIRSGVRHLSFVDQALRQQGLDALHTVPLEVLQHALQQFEGLVTNWSPRGLASLRSKMSVAASEREDQGEPSGLLLPELSASSAARKLSAGQR